MPGDERQVDFGNHGAFITEDSREQLLSLLETPKEVVGNLLFHGLGTPATLAQIFQVRQPSPCCHFEVVSRGSRSTWCASRGRTHVSGATPDVVLAGR